MKIYSKIFTHFKKIKLWQKIYYLFAHPQYWRRWFKTVWLDISYGNFFLGQPLANGDLSKGQYNTTSSDYEALEVIFSQISINSNDIIVDIGCGKGRVFNWLLKKKITNQLIGLEIDFNVASFSRKRLKKFANITICTGSIVNGIPQGSIYYIFNPFNQNLIKNLSAQLIEKIKAGRFNQPDRPVILYYNCVYLDIFDKDPQWSVQKLNIISSMNLPAAIIKPAIK